MARVKVREDGSAQASPRWRKSSYSNFNGECVELAELDSAVLLRDSKVPAGPVVQVARGVADTFVRALRSGRFDG
ncbi:MULTISPECIES: DUF397 domain-containing protein [Streptomyces]|uniref:DUF397 domain-containing protein n=1 Tax=Streptomyces lichenis TaxID=2306967 RepID=A0ABT0I9U7_9ACTN|nr:DUF397 domain-containing protein [Streptomyces lichenis]MCK8678083.1 DUF397 domain-containing protein [Streptomyces lichenis]